MYKKNILLDHFHTFFRSFNVTQGIWMVYLWNQGFNLMEIALFEVIFHLTSILFEIPTGAIADMFGRKTSRILGILSYFIYIIILLTSKDFYVVSLGFVFCSLSYVFESGAAEAIIYDTMIHEEKEDKFMRFLGTKEAIFQIAGFISLFIAGKIASFSYSYNYFITIFFFIIALILIFNMKEVELEAKKEKIPLKDQVKNQFIISTKTVFQNKKLLLLIMISALMAAPVTTLFFFLQNYFDLNGVPIEIITVYLGLHALASAFGGVISHWVEKKLGERLILRVIPFLISIMFWLILYEKILVIPFVFLGVLDSIFYVVLTDYMNKLIGSEERATVLSFSGMSFSIVMVGLFGLVGYLVEYIDFHMAFMILAIIVTIFFVLLQFLLNNGNSKDKQTIE